MLLDEQVAAAFGVLPEITSLGGSEQRTFAAQRPDGERVVLRHFAFAAPGAEPREAIEWQLDVLGRLPQEGFRVERPLPARDRSWLISGWSAWTWLEGRKAKPEHVLEVLPAIEAFHAALAQVPYAPHLTEQAGLADRAAWDDEPIPSGLPPELAGPVERLATLRRPLPDLRNQVIHGDLNYHNILIARTSARYGTTNAHSSSLASLGYGLRGTVSMPPPPQPPRHAR